MTPEAQQQAAQHFWTQLDSGQRIAELPEAQRPETEAEGHAIQVAFAQHSSQPIAGWKIAATSKAGQQHLAIDGPLAGRVLMERVLPDQVTLDLDHNLMAVVEAELAFIFGEDLPPPDQPYSVERVMEAVADLRPTIEIPDSRYLDFTKVGKAQLLADNSCAWWLLVGAAAPSDWRFADLRQHQVQLFRNGQMVRKGIGSNVLGDPREALTWLVNDVNSRGETLLAGQLVTTGTCLVPVTVQPGDEILSDYGLFGQLRMRMAR
jgi:2-keto-4-pentenoate hydratase